MNVLNTYRTYYPDPPGGLQEAIRQICLATSSLGVKNTIFTLSPNPKPNVLAMPEATVVRERSWIAPASCDIGGYTAYSTYLSSLSKADIVHYFHPWPFADVLNIFKTSDKPAVLTYISDVVRQRVLGALYAPLMWQTLKKMDVIIANCSAYVETSPILSHPSIRGKVKVIPLGIDESSYPKNGDDSVFSRVGINVNEPYFLFLGVLRYYKGIHTLISAAKSLNAKVVIAGSGPESEKLKKQVESIGLNNIFFARQVTNKEKISLIKNCTALVLPSHLRSEAYGMVLVEASMMGKPMISCEIGTGTSYVNYHDETGLVVKPENVGEMHEAMQTILTNAVLAKKFGDNARKRYELLFSGKALGQAYQSVYASLVK
ncbi:MAG: glycosyltransferase [Pseudomonadota bacterium]